MPRANSGHYQSFYIHNVEILMEFRKLCNNLNISMSQGVDALVTLAVNKPKLLDSLFERPTYGKGKKGTKRIVGTNDK